MKILILGITGMLGSAMFRFLAANQNIKVYGTARSNKARTYFLSHLSDQIIAGIDIENHDSIIRAFTVARPEVVVNCVGLVKQLNEAKDPLLALPINSLLPHRLAALCQAIGARLIHISTDCVFSGTQGNYLETDYPDADDLYGRSKLLGEVDYPHAITLRTSIIGHELSRHTSLISWFLEQKGPISGFTKAIFSGLPTVELSRVIIDKVLPYPGMRGVYHVAAKPINKFDLLSLVKGIYHKDIEIIPSNAVVIDRSLNAERFNKATGYIVPEWPELIQGMYNFK